VLKTCRTCGEGKDETCFSPNGATRHPHCKQCRSEAERRRRESVGDEVRAQERARYQRNKTAKAESYRRYYEKNQDHVRARNAGLYRGSAEQRKAQAATYRQQNKDRVREWNGTRRAAMRQACPPWADRRAILEKYREARELEATTGIKHHVDHIVPLAHTLVCGLHVAGNLCVLPAGINLEKSNKWASSA